MEHQVNSADSIDLLQTQLKFTLWAIGVLMGILAFFMIRAFNAQAKKDEKQDAQIEKLGDMFAIVTDAVKAIEKSTAVTQEIHRQHSKELEKHDRIIEGLANSTKR